MSVGIWWHIVSFILVKPLVRKDISKAKVLKYDINYGLKID